MAVYFIKFFHLLFAMGLLGTVAFLFYSKNIRPWYKILFCFSFFALLTGTLLVYPAHFTFHTPWIKAAYLLLSMFIAGLVGLFLYPIKNKKLTKFIFLILFLLLLLITHDAVRKESFIF